MAYNVITTSRAEDDAKDVVHYIARTSPIAALEWLNGLRETLGRLDEFPLRFALIKDNKNADSSCRACL